MNLPLKNVKVLEQGTFITGPCAGMMLADLGADVIKVETPGSGDPYRTYQEGHYSPHFQAYNRNKRSVALNLKSEDDKKIFDQLVAEADVFIQNFRPGAAERMGAGYERLSEINPRLVYCSISGFGKDGPYRDRPSYDSVAQALSGFLGIVTDRERPRFLGPALADAITGIYAAYGVLGALVSRGTDGKGRLVEVSMLEAMAHFAIEPFTALFALGQAPVGLDRPRLAQAHILKTRDDKLVAIHLSSPEKFWDELTEAFDAQHLREDPRFATRLARIDNYEALGEELNAITARRDRAEWATIMEKFDVPFAAVNEVAEVVEDPQVNHLNLIVPVEKTGDDAADRAVRPAVTVDGEPFLNVRPAPRLDADGEAIRRNVAEGKGWPELAATKRRLEEAAQ
ncbi:CoA transferase [Pelagibacterium sp. 26DY04]|uniref:CaiB/BaiF CoA transferase family protein n=1 Tax=Pelagibacterium sp. 26DY04 TaxID=2967130 RepID=UPI002815A440|nr:CoA transferase [Pelagibacterium sp. 26DY04]WMT88200.1 CoA transferase [Pelagibacterium sp. 26DY04]